MFKGSRRTIAAIAAAVGLGIGSAVWATSAASAAPSAAAGSAAAAAVPECTSADLAVWVDATIGNAAAGSVYLPLEFTNISSHTCFLVGWPGVFATNMQGKVLGSGAAREPTPARTFVDVAPGGTAHAILRYVDVQIDHTAACKETPASLLSVYPPDQTAARIAFFSLPVCTVPGRIYLRIYRIEAGLTGL